MSNPSITVDQVVAYRLTVHHLNKKESFEQLSEVAGVIGLQNSPPGAWENALFNRIEPCTLDSLHEQLYNQKTLLQAWSFRGVPLVFPSIQSDVFLRSLIPLENEQPWIYTLGLSGALDYLEMRFEVLLTLLRQAITCLDTQTIQSKELLDRTLADLLYPTLPIEKQTLWNSPSMYGANQRVGEAVVSFLLRPCSHLSEVVFGERLGNTPTFTSYQNWLGTRPLQVNDPEKVLVRKFLHCYAPAQINDFMKWLGSSTAQAKRLWASIADEMMPIQFQDKTCYLLKADLETMQQASINESTILLIHAHDPYLDIRDRTTILYDKKLHSKVWKMVGNPNVILKGGKVIGIWTSRTVKENISFSYNYWEMLDDNQISQIKNMSINYAKFRKQIVKQFTFELLNH